MIDVKRLAVDADYWDEVAPLGATHYWEPASDWYQDCGDYALVWTFEKKEWVRANAPLRITRPEAIPRLQPQKPISDDCLSARIGEIGNQIHNLGCENQNDEDLSDRLGELAAALWDLADLAPKEPSQPEWVDGLPPVGSLCKYAYLRSDTSCNGKCEILGYNGDKVWFKPTCAKHVTMSVKAVVFRPIPTPEQRQREELYTLITNEWAKGGFSLTDAILSRYTLERKL